MHIEKGHGLLLLIAAVSTSLHMGCGGGQPLAVPVSPQKQLVLSEVSSLVAEATSSGIKLSWSYSDKVDEFLVRRSTGASGEFVEVASSKAFYLDEGKAQKNGGVGEFVSGATYRYQVAAKRGGIVSGYKEVSFSFSNSSFDLPKPASLSASTTETSLIKLSWESVQDSRVTGYEVYRGTSESNVASLIFSTTSNYTTANDEITGVYYYQVLAVGKDANGNVIRSLRTSAMQGIGVSADQSNRLQPPMISNIEIACENDDPYSLTNDCGSGTGYGTASGLNVYFYHSTQQSADLKGFEVYRKINSGNYLYAYTITPNQPRNPYLDYATGFATSAKDVVKFKMRAMSHTPGRDSVFSNEYTVTMPE